MSAGRRSGARGHRPGAGLYRPGTSVLHRLPAGAKLAGLAVLALVVSLVPHTAGSAALVLLLVAGGYLLTGVGLGALWRQLWQLRGIVVVLAAALWIFIGPLTAWITTVRVVSIVLLAGLLTLTTRTGDVMDALLRVLRPLERLGVNTEVVALTVSLTITMIPVVAGFAARVREAERARGVRLGVRAIVPLMVMTMRHADEVGDALAARGLA